MINANIERKILRNNILKAGFGRSRSISYSTVKKSKFSNFIKVADLKMIH